MKYVQILFILLMTTSCGKYEPKKETIEVPITYWENSIELRVQSPDGKDLLNKNNVGCYTQSDIEVLESSNKQNAVSINQYPNKDYFYLRLTLNYNKVDLEKGKLYKDEVVTWVVFGNNEADEIKALFEVKYEEGDKTGIGTSSGYTMVLQKAWFNSKQVYDKQSAQNTDWVIPTILKIANE